MTRYEQKIFFTALAFAVVLIRDANLSQEDNEARVLRLAGLFEDFCERHIQLVAGNKGSNDANHA